MSPRTQQVLAAIRRAFVVVAIVAVVSQCFACTPEDDPGSEPDKTTRENTDTPNGSDDESVAITSLTPEDVPVAEAGQAALEAFENEDAEGLAALAHPDKGVRFSPYAAVDVESDVLMSAEEIRAFWSDSDERMWGSRDGSGEPIELTPTEYAREFIVDEDFSADAAVHVDDDQAHGNTVNNAAEEYPDGHRVEFYIEPSGEMGGMDWAALRFVFEDVDGEWRLVAVIHDEWTI